MLRPRLRLGVIGIHIVAFAAPWQWKPVFPWNILELMFTLAVIAIPVGLGFWASSIAKKKDRSAGRFFALGFVLGVIGIIIAAVVRPGPPPGTRGAICRRCSARQNVDPRQPTYECWQCKAVSRIAA
jgi:hypothetical protein